MKKRVLGLSGAWADAFGEVEASGVWFVWGNSGNGKTSFVMQLCKELCRFGKVVYNSLEEETSLTMQNTLRRFRMDEMNGRMLIVHETPEEMKERLSRRRSADFIVVDSFQYTQMTYRGYLKLKGQCRGKLLILVSHADGMMPSGRSAKSVMYDATLKIWVEGYVATSKGRFIGRTGKYIIWEEGARACFGEAFVEKLRIKN